MKYANIEYGIEEDGPGRWRWRIYQNRAQAKKDGEKLCSTREEAEIACIQESSRTPWIGDAPLKARSDPADMNRCTALNSGKIAQPARFEDWTIVQQHDKCYSCDRFAHLLR